MHETCTEIFETLLGNDDCSRMIRHVGAIQEKKMGIILDGINITAMVFVELQEAAASVARVNLVNTVVRNCGSQGPISEIIPICRTADAAHPMSVLFKTSVDGGKTAG